MDDRTRTEIEAAVFRRLVEHFRERTDVQNIDVMNLAGFCRNCLAKWYRAAAAERGVDLEDPQAREIIYGMPYDHWKAMHQTRRERGAAAGSDTPDSPGTAHRAERDDSAVGGGAPAGRGPDRK